MPLPWRTAQLIEARQETATARTLVLQVDEWPGHRPGQHVDVRLTAEDGYATQRSYSIASAPDVDRVELTVQLLADGEVSPFLVGEYAIGDPIELRGPIGGWFAWDPTDPQPVLLVGGGSGVVPLMSMLRTHRRLGADARFQLVYSVRGPGDVLYADELKPSEDAEVTVLFTRAAPAGWPRSAGRVNRDDLDGLSEPRSRVYLCGPTGFVEAAAELLIRLGHDAGQIRTERFGPTGA